MNPRIIANICVIPTAVFLVVIGIVHTIVNVSGLRRAIARGEISARFGDSMIANAAFTGVAISTLGILVLLVLPGIRAGQRQAQRLATAVGLLVSALGIAGFLWIPTRPSVLIFLFFGALLAVPLLIWRREFSNS